MSKRRGREEQKEWEARACVAAQAEKILGEAQWFLFSCYGKYMGGPPYSGLYVSGMPFTEVHRLLDALAAGETIPVHLMHRHKSGRYERSSLRLHEGVLIMVYADEEVPAA